MRNRQPGSTRVGRASRHQSEASANRGVRVSAETRPGGRMRNLQLAFPAMMALCVAMAAQDRSRFEVFGGYSLERIAPCGVPGSGEYPCNAETGFLAPTTTFNG